MCCLLSAGLAVNPAFNPSKVLQIRWEDLHQSPRNYFTEEGGFASASQYQKLFTLAAMACPDDWLWHFMPRLGETYQHCIQKASHEVLQNEAEVVAGTSGTEDLDGSCKRHSRSQSSESGMQVATWDDGHCPGNDSEPEAVECTDSAASSDAAPEDVEDDERQFWSMRWGCKLCHTPLHEKNRMPVRGDKGSVSNMQRYRWVVVFWCGHPHTDRR